MSIRHTAFVLVLLLAAVPASADGPDLLQPCDNPGALPVVTVAEGVTVDVDTPLGSGVPLLTTVKVQTVDGGDYLVDLAGEQVGTKKTVEVALSWTNTVDDSLPDYDMIVNGTVYQATTNPEVASLSMGHCKTISVDEIYAYTGVPTDELSLDLSVSAFSF